MSLDIRHIWCGGHIQKPSMKLKAGILDMLYENGNLRFISAGGNEILRMIYPAVRDRNWLTIVPEITSEQITRNTDSFRIKYSCIYKGDRISLKADYELTGKNDNSITFEFTGEITEASEKNRIGFCILHPVEGCAGEDCTITHSDGQPEKLQFPTAISAEQPFIDIKAMSWISKGCECNIEFTGDIFETEDQRNWTDASFKTYSTPLHLPFPVRLEKGQTLSQKVVFNVVNNTVLSPEAVKRTRISIETGTGLPLPATGIGRSTRPEALEDSELNLIKEIGFSHYRTDIYLFDENWRIPADRALEEAEKTGCINEFILFPDDNYLKQLDDFTEWLGRKGLKEAIVTIFHKNLQLTPENVAQHSYSVLKKYSASIKAGTGTNANFAQLNRQKDKLTNADFISFAVHPQEHASDNGTLVENLKAQQYAIESARAFAGEKLIRVSPVNIQRRFNASIENYEVPCSSGKFPPQADSRLMSLFGACWTAGSFKYLAESGVSAVTYHETAGERGIMQGIYDTRWSDSFRTKPGMLFPVYHLFKWILSDKTFGIVKSYSSSPLSIEVLALRKGQQIKIALMNFSHLFQTVSLDIAIENAVLYSLETESFEAACNDPSWIINCKKDKPDDLNNLNTGPFSVTFIEGIINK